MNQNLTLLDGGAQRVPSFLDAKKAVPNPDGSANILRFGGGLDLWVTPQQKMWRCKVQRDGKRTTVNLGTFPDLSIVKARAKRAALRDSRAKRATAPNAPPPGVDETLITRIALRVALVVREELARFGEGR